MDNQFSSIEQLSVNTIRSLSIDGVQKAKSGHPGMPMGAAPMAFVLWSKFLNHNSKNSKWANRDRFVLSAGHGSMLIYSLLHLFGYKISLDDLKNFRQLGSITPGHPEFGHTDGIETTTGPLGQGFANAVGMAIAEKFLSAKFNKPNFNIFNYKIFGICGDGDLMEGVSSEAASLAGHLKLNNLIFLYDDNNISIDGNTNLTFTEDVEKRFLSYGWQVLKVEDGNNLSEIENAILNCNTEKPTLIKVKTHIGFGSPNKQDSAEAHGSPLGVDEIKLTKKNYGVDDEKTFFIPENVTEHFKILSSKGLLTEKKWNDLVEKYKTEFPENYIELKNYLNGNIGNEWKNHLPIFTNENGNIATREASGKIIEILSEKISILIGGSADLTPSNNTKPKQSENFSAENYSGRYLRFGVREHAMGSIMNGIALSGLIPYGGTFLIFSDYMRPAIRLAALMKQRAIYVFTHDSIGLGEDGPTHQPIEQIMSLRQIPNLTVIRPADATETVEAWKYAIENKTGPTVLALTRQKTFLLDDAKYNSKNKLKFGAYVLTENTATPELILIASGSEVNLALSVFEKLSADGIKVRVVSMPSWEIFEQQTEEYKNSILPKNILKRVSIEAGVSHGWQKYVGNTGLIFSIDSFGQSAPAEILFKEFGFTIDNIYEKSKKYLV